MSKDNLNNKSYFNIVFNQFKKKKSAIASLWIIVFLFFIAIFAPFLANDKPLVLYSTYDEHFRYFLASFKKTKANYIESLINKEKLIIERKEKIQKHSDIKKSIYASNKENDLYGNQYEKLKKEIDRLSVVPDKKDAVKKLTEKRKKVGARQNEIKARMLALNTKREALATRLLQLNTKLALKKNALLISKSINNLMFPLTNDKREKIAKIKEEYNNLFLKHSYGKDINKANLKLFIRKLNTLEANLDHIFKKRGGYLKKRFTFPVLEDLSFTDIFFMSSFLALIHYPLIMFFIRKLFSKKVALKLKSKKARLIFISSLFILVLICFYALKNDSIIPTNHKKIFASNFAVSSSSQKTIENSSLSRQDNTFALFPVVYFGFNENIIEEKLQKPSLFNNKASRHILGTDDTGRDVLSRMIWGSRISLSVGFVAVSIYVLIGILFGAIAGYFGGLVDLVISRVIEVVICFPSFFLILTIIAFVGPSITNIMIIIGLTSWPGIARLVRGEFLRLRNEDFVISAKSLGASDFKIMLKYILPNSLTPVLVSATFGIASAMLIEAGLSFLGFGVREPFPSWGMMISTAQGDVLNYWWLSLIPGFAIFIAVTSYNLLGDALREALDPKLK